MPAVIYITKLMDMKSLSLLQRLTSYLPLFAILNIGLLMLGAVLQTGELQNLRGPVLGTHKEVVFFIIVLSYLSLIPWLLFTVYLIINKKADLKLVDVASFVLCYTLLFTLRFLDPLG